MQNRRHSVGIHNLLRGLRLVDFRESFHIYIQNGVSRKKIALSFFSSIAVYAFVLSILLCISDILCLKMFHSTDLYAAMFLVKPEQENMILKMVVYTLLMVASAGIGYVIAVIFYRMGSKGKRIYGVLLPIIVFAVLPNVFLGLNEIPAIAELFEKFIIFTGNIGNSILLFLLCNVILYVISDRLVAGVQLNIKQS